MSLIIMCCHDTEENGRSEYTEKTLISLSKTVDWANHRLVVVDNASCESTKKLLFNYSIGNKRLLPYKERPCISTVITLSENVGTARGINFGLKLREPGENAIKIDNDVVIHHSGWVEEMEEVIRRSPEYGIVGLKRKDLRQTPYDPDPNFKSEPRQLPHQSGETWITVEETNDIMGTCTMFSSALLDKIGGMAQPGLYGFDDSLYGLRSRLSGFKNCFLPHINIDHIDTGSGQYSGVKQRQAADVWEEYMRWHEGYCNGSRSLFVEL